MLEMRLFVFSHDIAQAFWGRCVFIVYRKIFQNLKHSPPIYTNKHSVNFFFWTSTPGSCEQLTQIGAKILDLGFLRRHLLMLQKDDAWITECPFKAIPMSVDSALIPYNNVLC